MDARTKLKNRTTKARKRGDVTGEHGIDERREATATIAREGQIMKDEPTGMYELLDAIEDVIKTADPAKRANLAKTIAAYADDFPDEFFWAVGAQAPTLLSQLLMAIDVASRPEAQSKPRVAIRPGSAVKGHA